MCFESPKEVILGPRHETKREEKHNPFTGTINYELKGMSSVKVHLFLRKEAEKNRRQKGMGKV